MARHATRPVRIAPPLRPPKPTFGPTRRAVLAIWEDADEWSCTYCDSPAGPMVVLEMDHVTPLSLGGVHDFHNLSPACRECNRRKGDLSVGAWGALLAAEMGAECCVPAP
ncbi:HNH endonuclease [Streptomyces sp. NBC_00239]|uniref:HNH endonuclease n=1 Tax=Streptomyces sp. NBC_00239 TaxID=2903640 RepID=UPI003FA6AD05